MDNKFINLNTVENMYLKYCSWKKSVSCIIQKINVFTLNDLLGYFAGEKFNFVEYIIITIIVFAYDYLVPVRNASCYADYKVTLLALVTKI